MHGGITPAYAGKREIENVSAPLFAGSPPPMRGKVLDLLEDLCAVGITPAYAGKSGLHDVLPVPAEDHPRLCGEKFVVSAFVRDFGGSPPPMRGKAAVGMYRREMWGITPAYAGKRSLSWTAKTQP